MFPKLALLAIAGACGTLARYGVTSWVQRANPSAFPWGTVVVNLLGCFAFGVVWGYVERKVGAAEGLRLYALTGFMGAFTTFSTFAFDTSVMLARGEFARAAGHLALQNGAGVALVVAGLWLGRNA